MRTKKTKVAPEESSRWRWLTTPWGVAVAVGTVAGAILLNINSVVINARNLPDEVRKTSHQFSSWYYDDAGWSGYWTSQPDGHVDQADMNLSQVKVGVELEVRNGKIDGMISTQAVCDRVPVFDFLLLRGNVDTFGDSATVVAWDIFGGHAKDLAKLKLSRDGIIMSVVPKEGAVGLFPDARLARDPNTNSWPEEFCTGKRERFLKLVERLAEEERAKEVQERQRSPSKRRLR